MKKVVWAVVVGLGLGLGVGVAAQKRISRQELFLTSLVLHYQQEGRIASEVVVHPEEYRTFTREIIGREGDEDGADLVIHIRPSTAAAKGLWRIQ